MSHGRETRQDLLAKIDGLNQRISDLTTVEQERDIALEECAARDTTIENQRGQINRLENELIYARTELTRATVQGEELQALRKRLAGIMAICRVSHSKLGTASKIAMITAHEQVPYSAEVHGGEPGVMLMSMKKWNAAIGGDESNPRNTNIITRALEPLSETRTITRELVDLHDGRKHYKFEFNEAHFNNPLLIKPTEERKHNGGDKSKCDACGSLLKKKFTITYTCTNPACGIDYDQDGHPIDHTPLQAAPVQPEPAAAPVKPLIILTQPELRPEPEQEPPTPMYLRRPIACRCGLRRRWIQTRNGGTHCTHCEIEYRGRAS